MKTNRTTSIEMAADAATDARHATEQRDYWIRQARDEGSSLRAIAELTGLSHTAIANICQKANP